MIDTDVCIIGAGPGGAAAALKLSYLGIPCVLVDRAEFPRDKVCGDAISGKVTTLLQRLDPAILARFHAEPARVGVWGVKFVAPNGKAVRIPFHPIQESGQSAPAPGYVSKRVHFDHFLVEEARRRPNISVHTGVDIQRCERVEGGWLASDARGDFSARARLLLMANGAQSAFSRRQAGLRLEPRHHAGAVRAYYRGVRGMDEDNFIELHFVRELIPGYFWVFPLPNGEANVGLGMRSDVIKRRGVNLRQALLDVVERHPYFRERFRHAERLGDIKGYGLPLGSKTRKISGDGYILLGDAASLIDPLTGEGIGNAFYSGFIAAEQARDCLAANNFSAAFLQAYDRRVRRVLGSEMQLSYRLQKAGAYAPLLNMIANLISGNQNIMNYLSGIYTDFSLREQLVKPLFWLKLLGRK